MIKYTERLILGLLVASVTTNDNPDEEIKTLPPHMDNELNELNDITYYNNSSQRECVDCNCYLGNVYEVGNATAVELGGLVGRYI